MENGPVCIHGVVLAGEQPQAGVTVRLSHGKHKLSASQTVSDEYGQYRFDDVPRNTWYVVTAQGGNAYGYEFMEIISDDMEWDVTLVAGAFIAGRTVTETGEAVANADISSVVLYREAALPVLTSDKDGYFTMPFPDAFFCNQSSKYAFITAEKDGLVGYLEHRVNRTGSRPTAVIIMRPGALLSGRVLDEKGRPLADVDVSAVPGGIRPCAVETHTDSLGQFSLAGLAPTSYVVSAAKNYLGRSDTVTSKPIAETLSPGEQVTDLEFRLFTATASCDGRVADSRGTPLGEVSVTLSSTTTYREINCLTDDSGRFSQEDVPVDEYRLFVSCEDHIPYVSEPFSVPVSALDITLEQAPVISGVVTDALTGAPLADVYISVDAAMPNKELDGFSPTWEDVATDESGRYTVSLRTFGAVTVKPFLEGYGRHSETIEVTPGQQVDDLSFALEPGSTLYGVVLTAKGQCVEDAVVSMKGFIGAEDIVTTTDEAGCFTLKGLPSGGQRIVIDYLHVSHEFDSGETSSRERPQPFVLPGGGALRCTISGPRAEKVSASLLDANGGSLNMAKAHTQDDTLSFEEIPAGRYMLLVHNGVRGNEGGAPHYARDVVVTAGCTTDIALALGGGPVTLTGTCYLAAFPVLYADLTLVYLDKRDSAHGVYQARSDEGGHYRFSDVPSGRAILIASSDLACSTSRDSATTCYSYMDLTIAQDGEVNQDVHFCPDRQVIGRIPDLHADESVTVDIYPLVLESLLANPITKALLDASSCSRTLWNPADESFFQCSGLGPGSYAVNAVLHDQSAGGARARSLTGAVTVPESASGSGPYEIRMK